MSEHKIHVIMLEQYARRLFVVSRQLNYHLSLCCSNKKYSTKKLKLDAQMAKELIANIENEINSVFINGESL